MAERYYIHGDKRETEDLQYFCHFCDLFNPSIHFTDGPHNNKHHGRYNFHKQLAKGLFKNFPKSYTRPTNAENIVQTLPKDPKITKSRFYTWLMKQSERDDPVGDIAGDIKRDRSFPLPINSIEPIRNYLILRRACDESIQALEEAWAEFSPGSKTRSNLSLKLRFEVFRMYNYSCQICGATAQDGAKLEVDHKIPIAKGGTNDIPNLWALCFKCNRGKSASDL